MQLHVPCAGRIHKPFKSGKKLVAKRPQPIITILNLSFIVITSLIYKISYRVNTLHYSLLPITSLAELFVPVENFPVGRRITEIGNVHQLSALHRRLVSDKSGEIEACGLPDIGR